MSELGEYVRNRTLDVDGDLSIRKVATQAGVAFETVRRVLNGRGQVSDETLQALATAFPALNLAKMRELAGLGAQTLPPFEAPREFDQLNPEERRVVVAVGRQILRSSGRLDQPFDDGTQGNNGDVTHVQAQ